MQNNSSHPPLILAGSGRSGTTWILDVLSELNGLRPVFEPLHPDAIPVASPYTNKYIASEERHPKLQKFLDTVFDGSFNSLWSDYRIRTNLLMPRLSSFSSPGSMKALWGEWASAVKRYKRYGRLLKSSPVLVKIIRGNLMLGWLREHYNARIVFVVRHPGAVVESRLRISGPSWDTGPMLESYRNGQMLGPLEERYASLLNSKLDPAEAHTLIWCIENQLPMERASIDGYPVIFYESLLSDGEREWQRIVAAFEVPVNPFGSEVLSKPSQQSALARRKKINRGGTWLDRLNERDRKGVQRILDETGVTIYSMDNLSLLAES